MPTETDVANLALSKIGGAGDQESGTGIIGSINANTRVAVRCKLLLKRVRPRVLSDLAKADAAPKEALVYTDLGAETTTNLEMGGWSYVFNLPKDTIAIVRQIEEVFDTVKTSLLNKVREYSCQLRWDGSDPKLFTNDLSNDDNNSAFIERVFDQKNPGTWTEPLLDAIATLLASELVKTIGAVDEERLRLLAEYKDVCLPTAIAFIGSQDKPYVRVVQDYLGERNKRLTGHTI